MILQNEIRGCDEWGCGEFGASRGDHKHKGIDIKCYANQMVNSPIRGTITKIGYPYSQRIKKKKHFRYIEIRNDQTSAIRIYYVLPEVVLNEYVERGEFLGRQQVLGDVFPGITEHIHLEVIVGRSWIDPIEFFRVDC